MLISPSRVVGNYLVEWFGEFSEKSAVYLFRSRSIDGTIIYIYMDAADRAKFEISSKMFKGGEQARIFFC